MLISILIEEMIMGYSKIWKYLSDHLLMVQGFFDNNPDKLSNLSKFYVIPCMINYVIFFILYIIVVFVDSIATIVLRITDMRESER